MATVGEVVGCVGASLGEKPVSELVFICPGSSRGSTAMPMPPTSTLRRKVACSARLSSSADGPNRSSASSLVEEEEEETVEV